MESPIYKRCMCGGLIVSMFVGGVAVEACERTPGASACPMPRVEYNHTHFPEPRGPSLARQSYVLGTGTDTGTGTALPPGQQLSDFPAPRRNFDAYDTSWIQNTTLTLHTAARLMPVVATGTNTHA
jgi:hypothetical protein